MKHHQHPWNLRRIFGRQFKGCVGRPSRPEARIAARMIPAQPSRWTFRGQGDVYMPTCRLADLPTLARLSEIFLFGLGGIEVAFLHGIHGAGRNTSVQNLAESGNGRRNV
jgi:hypothetical protein